VVSVNDGFSPLFFAIGGALKTINAIGSMIPDVGRDYRRNRRRLRPRCLELCVRFFRGGAPIRTWAVVESLVLKTMLLAILSGYFLCL